MSLTLVRTLGQQLSSEQTNVSGFDSYYAGTQPLAFLDPKVRQATQGRLQPLSVNWSRVVVGAVEERLDVEGFRIAGQDEPIPDLWRVWQSNRLDEQSSLAHTDALVHGRAFVLVWYGEDPLTPSITVESAREMTVSVDPGTQQVTAALKQYRDGQTVHSILYLADRVERYVTDAQGERLVETTPHDFGRVPVVPFVNRPRAGLVTGESELTDVMPLVDAINKCGTDLLVSAEYHAMPRRTVTGIQLAPAGTPEGERDRELFKQYWTQAEAGRVWAGPAGANFDQFPEASLDNFINAIRMFTEQIAAIAKLPPYMLGLATVNPASAEALKSSEAGLIQKVRRKMRGFGGSWEAVMMLAARAIPGTQAGDLGLLETIWRSPETPTVAQQADAAVKLVQANIISAEQALEDLGYSPVQIDRERTRRDRASLGAVAVQIDEANRLQREQGLTQAAAFKAVGLLAAGNEIAASA